ncbi:hypothetical protein [Candidatus Poriferisodalis sp.]|uniref:hypothetical protein n=1 Tax=Candidatus Poriferisodalis sp. TaxID=3101277 RepID=UPI003B52EC22
MLAQGLIPTGALAGVRVGISVSDSDDLPRLGLANAHAELAIGEIARAVLVAGGSLVYGGRIRPSGFTQCLLHEIHRYGRSDALTLCLAAPEHRKLSRSELDSIDRQLGSKGRVVCLDERGNHIPDILKFKPPEPEDTDEAAKAPAFSALRRLMGTITDARVLLGGNLSTFAGSMPGILEEAIIAVAGNQPLLVSAGFGGAAALAARHLGIDDLGWAPSDFPRRPDDVRIDRAVAELEEAAADSGWDPRATRLETDELGQLSASHRAGEIAALAVRGLSRALS